MAAAPVVAPVPIIGDKPIEPADDIGESGSGPRDDERCELVFDDDIAAALAVGVAAAIDESVSVARGVFTVPAPDAAPDAALEPCWRVDVDAAGERRGVGGSEPVDRGDGNDGERDANDGERDADGNGDANGDGSDDCNGDGNEDSAVIGEDVSTGELMIELGLKMYGTAEPPSPPSPPLSPPWLRLSRLRLSRLIKRLPSGVDPEEGDDRDRDRRCRSLREGIESPSLISSKSRSANELPRSREELDCRGVRLFDLGRFEP